MCIAIPYGKEKTNESRLWKALRTSPFYLLTLGVVIQILLLAVFQLLLSSHYISSSAMLISPVEATLYSLLFGMLSFIFFAISMFVYQQRMQSGDIEYIYYGSFFFLMTYNSMFFYLAIFTAMGLVFTSIVIHFGLLFFTFKPLWRAYFWADKHNKNLARGVNTVFFLLVFTQILFLINVFLS